MPLALEEQYPKYKDKIVTARNYGYADDDILGKINGKVNEARGYGYTDEEILDHLGSPKTPPPEEIPQAPYYDINTATGNAMVSQDGKTFAQARPAAPPPEEQPTQEDEGIWWHELPSKDRIEDIQQTINNGEPRKSDPLPADSLIKRMSGAGFTAEQIDKELNHYFNVTSKTNWSSSTLQPWKMRLSKTPTPSIASPDRILPEQPQLPTPIPSYAEIAGGVTPEAVELAKGQVEAGMSTASGLSAFLPQLGARILGGYTKGPEWAEKTSQFLTYEPRTEQGKTISGTLNYPFALLGQAEDKLVELSNKNPGLYSMVLGSPAFERMTPEQREHEVRIAFQGGLLATPFIKNLFKKAKVSIPETRPIEAPKALPAPEEQIALPVSPELKALPEAGINGTSAEEVRKMVERQSVKEVKPPEGFKKVDFGVNTGLEGDKLERAWDDFQTSFTGDIPPSEHFQSWMKNRYSKFKEPPPIEGKVKPPHKMTLEEFKNYDFETPVGGGSVKPSTIWKWRKGKPEEVGETLADLATHTDDFRFKEVLGKGWEHEWKNSLSLENDIKQGKEITIWRARPKGEPSEIMPGSYVSESREYATKHGENILGGDYTLVSEKVHPDELLIYGDPHEFIYYPRNAEIAHQRIIEKARPEGKVKPQEEVVAEKSAVEPYEKKEPLKMYHQSDTGELKLGKDIYGLGEGYFVSSKKLPKGFYGSKDVTIYLKPETKLFDFQQWAKESNKKLRIPPEDRAKIIEEASTIAREEGYDGIEIMPDDIWVFDKKSIIPKETPKTLTKREAYLEKRKGIKPIAEMQKETKPPPYLYHGTTQGALRKIVSDGLKPSTMRQISLSDTEQYAKTYADRKGGSRGIILRIKNSEKYVPDTRIPEGGDYLSKEAVKPEDIEVKMPNGSWEKLTDVDVSMGKPEKKTLKSISTMQKEIKEGGQVEKTIEKMVEKPVEEVKPVEKEYGIKDILKDIDTSLGGKERGSFSVKGLTKEQLEARQRLAKRGKEWKEEFKKQAAGTFKDFRDFLSSKGLSDDKKTKLLLYMKQEDKVNKELENIKGKGIFTKEELEIKDELTKKGKVANEQAQKVQEEQKTALDKMVDAVKKAKAPRKELEKLYREERRKRAGAIAGIMEKGEGEKGYYQSLSKLKGELAPEKPRYEGIKNKLTQDDVDSLFSTIQKHKDLNPFEKITAQTGLYNVFNGKIPPHSQLSLLEDVFGKELVEAVISKRPFSRKLMDMTTEVLNIPKTLTTFLDMSAVLRQGIFFVRRFPSVGRSIKQMFRQVFSQKNFDNWLDDLKHSKDYEVMKESKLYIADPNKISGGLSAKEERFMTNLAERIPTIGRGVKASERAYVGYLNALRVDVFRQIAKKMQEKGYDPKENPKVFKSIADLVNNGTGRGDIGRLQPIAQELNTAFFSPRLIAARFNLLLNPMFYAKLEKPVRMEAVKDWLGFVGIGMTVLALAKLNGADVEVDLRSSDFGKIKVGNTRWDIWGGFQQWVRLAAQLASKQRKSTSTGKIYELSGKKFPFETRLDVATRFIKGKLAPVPSLVVELLEGQKIYGGDITLKEEAIERMIPMYIQDIDDAIKQFGPEAIFTTGVPAFFGTGVQTYEEKKKTSTSEGRSRGSMSRTRTGR